MQARRANTTPVVAGSARARALSSSFIRLVGQIKRRSALQDLRGSHVVLRANVAAKIAAPSPRRRSRRGTMPAPTTANTNLPFVISFVTRKSPETSPRAVAIASARRNRAGRRIQRRESWGIKIATGRPGYTSRRAPGVYHLFKYGCQNIHILRCPRVYHTERDLFGRTDRISLNFVSVESTKLTLRAANPNLRSSTWIDIPL